MKKLYMKYLFCFNNTSEGPQFTEEKASTLKDTYSGKIGVNLHHVLLTLIIQRYRYCIIGVYITKPSENISITSENGNPIVSVINYSSMYIFR